MATISVAAAQGAAAVADTRPHVPPAPASSAISTPACPPPATAPDLSPSALPQALRRATDRGLLWRIERDGHASWLYGTLHLGRRDWLLPGPQVLRALHGSDTLALELDLLDPATQAVFAAPADAAATARVLTPERQRRIDQQVAAACLPGQALSRLRPALQVMTLSMLAGRHQGLYADYGAEAFLGGFARARGLPVVALERAADQLALLSGGTEAEEGELVDEGLDGLASGRAAAQLTELAEVWARSDGAKLGRYAEWCECADTPRDRQGLERLIDQRNPGLADGIERLHAQGRRVLGAVGALHMIGPQGLPALMAARGFRVMAVLPAPAP